MGRTTVEFARDLVTEIRTARSRYRPILKRSVASLRLSEGSLMREIGGGGCACRLLA